MVHLISFLKQSKTMIICPSSGFSPKCNFFMVTYLTRMVPVYNLQSILDDEHFQITWSAVPGSTTFTPAFRLTELHLMRLYLVQNLSLGT